MTKQYVELDYGELVDKQWTVSLYDKEHKECMRTLRQFAEEWSK